MHSPKIIGDKGEEIACQYAQQVLGYQILHRNWRYKKMEIDIIAFNPTQQAYVCIEVKTRQSNYFGYPEQAINNTKQRSLFKAIEAYNQQNTASNSATWHFEVIAITLPPSPNDNDPQIQHFTDTMCFYDNNL